MNKLFQVYPDNDWGKKYTIDAGHKWGLPGLRCSVCHQTWSNTGLAYPEIDLSSLPNNKRYLDFWPVPLDVFTSLCEPLMPLAPDGALLLPGTNFGPLIGTLKGEFGDFIWPIDWWLLIQETALARLREASLNLPIAVKTQIKTQGKRKVEMMEFQIMPHGKIAPASFNAAIGEPCSGCGRRETPSLQKVVVERNSIPRGVDLFRLSNFTTIILATEKFVDAVGRLHLSDILFREVEIAS
jgi:uncharacterized double-CXXCG motif protein